MNEDISGNCLEMVMKLMLPFIFLIVIFYLLCK